MTRHSSIQAVQIIIERMKRLLATYSVLGKFPLSVSTRERLRKLVVSLERLAYNHDEMNFGSWRAQAAEAAWKSPIIESKIRLELVKSAKLLPKEDQENKWSDLLRTAIDYTEVLHNNARDIRAEIQRLPS